MLVNSAQLFVHSIANALYQSAALFQEDITRTFVVCDRNYNVTHSTVFGWTDRGRDLETDC